MRQQQLNLNVVIRDLDAMLHRVLRENVTLCCDLLTDIVMPGTASGLDLGAAAPGRSAKSQSHLHERIQRRPFRQRREAGGRSQLRNALEPEDTQS